MVASKRKGEGFIALAADIGVCIMSAGLIGISFMCAAYPLQAADIYGVSIDDDHDAIAWVQATGLRDAALGVATLMLWLRSPAALQVYMPCVALVAMGDFGITMLHRDGHNSTSVLASALHMFGLVAIVILWQLLVQKHSKKNGTIARIFCNLLSRF